MACRFAAQASRGPARSLPGSLRWGTVRCRAVPNTTKPCRNRVLHGCIGSTDAGLGADHSHSIVSGALKPACTLALSMSGIGLYRHFYRQKTTALPSAGDAVGLRGGYSSASIVNYREAEATHIRAQPCERPVLTLQPFHRFGVNLNGTTVLPSTATGSLELPGADRRRASCTTLGLP
jgi:hypothetical protein